MLSPEEQRRLAELYSLGYESFLCDAAAAQQARHELDALLAGLRERECPGQSERDFRHTCHRQAKAWLKANQPKYPFLPPS